MNRHSQEYRMYTDEAFRTGRMNSPRFRRWLVFLLVFVPCVTASQIYIFLQPAIYRSTATVLTMAAPDVDQASPAADIQHVSLQRQILLGTEILEKTSERLQQITGDAKSFSVDQLRSEFDVVPEPETNLIHLQAQGPDPKRLELSVDAWINSYLTVRSAFIAENTAKTVIELNDQLQRIDRQVTDKRREIDQFRLQYNILSAESADNQVHARLQGLNASLNKALEEEVKAKAKFDAILVAISRDETLVPEEDSRAMAVLIQQAEKLRDELAAIEAHFTKDYIELNPNLRRVREQLADIEAKIAEKATVGKNFVRQAAERDYAAARQAVLTIQQQLENHKKQAADYTSRFATHQALQQELVNLETLQQETKQRLVDIDVKQRQKYPQVDVVDWAALPDQPISPDYLQQSLLAVACSLGLALLIVLIIDYLNRESPPSLAPVSLGGIHLHHKPQTMLDIAETQPQVIYEPLKELAAADTSRALSRDEVFALYQAADLSVKWVIALLLNGLSLSEVVTLTPENLDAASLMILIPGRRNVAMTPRVADLVAKQLPIEHWPSEDEIETLICCTAIDSGLQNPQEISAETLRYTYMLYLVGQGIKLIDLTKIVGSLMPSKLLALGKFSPEQAGIPLEKINLDYFF